MRNINIWWIISISVAIKNFCCCFFFHSIQFNYLLINFSGFSVKRKRCFESNLLFWYKYEYKSIVFVCVCKLKITESDRHDTTPAVLINSICLPMLMLVVVYCWLFLVNLILLSDDMFVACLLLHDVIVFVSLFFRLSHHTYRHKRKCHYCGSRSVYVIREREREREKQSLVCAWQWVLWLSVLYHWHLSLAIYCITMYHKHAFKLNTHTHSSTHMSAGIPYSYITRSAKLFLFLLSSSVC